MSCNTMEMEVVYDNAIDLLAFELCFCYYKGLRRSKESPITDKEVKEARVIAHTTIANRGSHWIAEAHRILKEIKNK